MPRSARRDGRGTGRLALVAAAGATAAAALALRLAAVTGLPSGHAASTLGTLPVEGLVEVGALAAGLLAAMWLALSAAVALGCVVMHRLGGRWAAGEAVLERVAPAVVRRLARSAVGLGVGTGLALAPSAALAADDAPAAPDPASAVAVVDLGWQPTTGDADAAGGKGATDAVATVDDGDTVEAVEAGSAAHAGPGGGTAAEPGITPAPAGDASVVARDLRGTTLADDDTVVVLRGDTLWDIAAARLAEHGAAAPSDADVLEEMTRWHQANRDVIGADPDVILPGQVLQPPG
ncbi:LysM peptidoglycan-binding domain-containing protein [Isoptericola sp. BMS4]|uniref:LysM peptidoglycan-binding domain-containing protein n=1 Tax=Isoptericola sp. BMS4 TaxID=2527875 RepID=UPI00141DCFDF|nr:hypothetical protein [Isoptericola sp. BMS4]